MIAKGKESVATTDFKRYVGVAACSIKAINPSKFEMEKLYGRTVENDPEYISDRDGVQTLRLTFVVQPNEKYGVNTLFTHSYFLRNEYRYNSDKTKVQVIDKYGRTAWVTIEQARNKAIPMYANGPANIDKDYRPAYSGEEDLTKFLIAYLNIPNPMRYSQEERKWYMVEHPEDSECRLDHIADYFKGNISEIKDAVALQPNNEVQILFTVRNADDGKQYQGSYTRTVLRASVGEKYDKLAEEIQSMVAQSNSASVHQTVYDVTRFHEYKVEATPIVEDASIDPLAADQLPFDMSGAPTLDPFSL